MSFNFKMAAMSHDLLMEYFSNSEPQCYPDVSHQVSVQSDIYIVQEMSFEEAQVCRQLSGCHLRYQILNGTDTSCHSSNPLVATRCEMLTMNRWTDKKAPGDLTYLCPMQAVYNLESCLLQ